MTTTVTTGTDLTPSSSNSSYDSPEFGDDNESIQISASDNNVIKQGWLTKIVNIITKKRHYYTLTRNSLLAHKSKTDPTTKKKHEIRLEECLKIYAKDDKSNSVTFIVEAIGKNHVLQCDTPSEMRQWVEILNKKNRSTS